MSLLRRAPNVERLTRKERWDRLAAALSYEDLITDRDGNLIDLGASVREDAATALAEADAPGAAKGLLRAVEDPEDRVRLAAVRGLGKRHEPHATHVLLQIATGWTGPEQAEMRYEALDALTRRDDPDVPLRAAELFIKRPEELDEADEEVMRTLADAAGEEGRQATIDALVRELHEVTGTSLRVCALLAAMGPDTVDALIDALDDPNAQRGAVLALGSIRDPRALEPLAELLRGSDSERVRRAAAWALGEIRDPAAADALLLATRDKDYDVRTAASASFDKLGNVAVAVVMSGLVRSALENGASAAAEAARVEEEVAPAPPAPLQPRPAATRAGGALRRLLERGLEPRTPR